MQNNDIKTIQNLLIQKDKYTLSLKLDGASYNLRLFHKENGISGMILELYVHPNHYLALDSLCQSEKDMLKSLFAGFVDSSIFIKCIEIKIAKEKKIQNTGDTVYIFVDESGDMDFTSKGSKHYLFTFLVKKRPFTLHEHISNYRYSLLERNLDPSTDKRLDIEAFHACDDNKHIREKVFDIIASFDNKLVRSYSYVLEKPKVQPAKRQDKDKFYINNLNLAIKKLLNKIEINKDFIIITDRLPFKRKKHTPTLKKGIKEYIKTNKLSIRYDIFHHSSASSINLQVVDYISWAIFRKYERNEDKYYKKIEKYLITIDNMTKNIEKQHYIK